MKFYPISIEEMREAFSQSTDSGKRWVETQVGHEMVFDFEFAPKAYIRVFTAITVGRSETRAKGSDAIRVVAFESRENKGLVKSMRVLRVIGWHANLRKAILTVHKLAKARMIERQKVLRPQGQGSA